MYQIGLLFICEPGCEKIVFVLVKQRKIRIKKKKMLRKYKRILCRNTLNIRDVLSVKFY